MIKIKTPEQIKILREGGKFHASVLRELAKRVKPGISTAELNKYVHELIIKHGNRPAFLGYRPPGAEYPYPASICVSIDNEVVHGIPSPEKILEEGSIVSFDLGIEHKELFTDAAITVPVGEVDQELLDLIETTKDALYAGISACKPGNYIGDIGAAIEKYNNGRYGIVREYAGHGVGLKIHEDPFIPNFGNSGEGDKLVPGMVLAIEPMFNLGTEEVIIGKDKYAVETKDKKASAHFEHTVLITEDGHEILTD